MERETILYPAMGSLSEDELRGAVAVLRDVAADLLTWKKTAALHSADAEKHGDTATAIERRHDSRAYDRVAMMIENRADGMELRLRTRMELRAEGRRIERNRRNRVAEIRREEVAPEFPEINSWRQTNETER